MYCSMIYVSHNTARAASARYVMEVAEADTSASVDDLTLPATMDYAAASTICTSDGRVSSVTVQGKQVVLQMGFAASPCDTFTLSYSRSETKKNIQTFSGHEAPDMEAAPVVNAQAGRCNTPQVVVQNGGASGNSGGTPGKQGKSLTVKFDRPLDTGKALKASAFGLAGAAGGAAPAVEGAAYTGSGAGVALTLARALESGETVTLSYARPRGEPGLWNAEGNQIADFSGVAVPVGTSGAPAVTGVEVVSDSGDDGTYALGETIRVRVTFSEAVEVDTADGKPRLRIDMDPAAHWGMKWMAWESGSGTAELVFAYEVVQPNESTQGIAVLAGTLEANGGAIRSVSGGTDAQLGHAGLGHDPAHKVDWRPTLSVADAEANEGTDAAVGFEVTLGHAANHRVTVDYATADGSATAGEDYTATSGTLTFAAGETVKTVSVPILDDVIDEGEETFTLTLSNAQGARIGDGEATGTISNDDPLQKMWLSRFGRTVAGHVTDAVSDRLANPLSGAQVTVGGQTVNLAEVGDEAWLGRTLTSIARAMGAPSGPAPANDDGWPGSAGLGSGAGGWPGTGLGGVQTGVTGGSAPARAMSGRELLLGSAFHLVRNSENGGPGLAAWGRVTTGGFDGEETTDSGTVRIDGSVTTGILGADAQWNRLLGGVAISVSGGEGSFDQPGVDSGKIESTMTTVSPYARFMVTDRVSVWGLAGWGTGDMTIVQAANENQPERVTRTDLEMRLIAGGGRGKLMEADETGGFDLALKADGLYVETESEAISNEGSTTGVASRVRLALEGSRSFEVGDGAVLRPSLELGLRHDGGDAETGTGVEIGGGVSYADPGSGLSVEAKARMLVAHADADYREWGATASVRLAPGERGRGLSFSLSPTLGAAGSATDRLWGARDAGGLAPVGAEFEASRGLDAELGYGLSLFGDRFTGTPNLGFGVSDTARAYRIGWRLTSAWLTNFSADLEATRRERPIGGEPDEHGLMLRGAVRW